jgi:hypothetical protein
VDHRAQGCVERGVFHVNALCLRPLRSAANAWALRGHVPLFRMWAHVQANAGDAAVCAVAAGLLAAE